MNEARNHEKKPEKNLFEIFIDLAKNGPSYKIAGPNETGLGDLEMSIAADADMRSQACALFSIAEKNPSYYIGKKYFREFLDVMNKLIRKEYPWQIRLDIEIEQTEAGIPDNGYWTDHMTGKYAFSFEKLSKRVKKLSHLAENIEVDDKNNKNKNIEVK